MKIARKKQRITNMAEVRILYESSQVIPLLVAMGCLSLTHESTAWRAICLAEPRKSCHGKGWEATMVRVQIHSI